MSAEGEEKIIKVKTESDHSERESADASRESTADDFSAELSEKYSEGAGSEDLDFASEAGDSNGQPEESARSGKLDSSFLSRDVDFDSAEVRSGISIAEFERVKREAADNHDRYIRALADFDNFRKRATKERSELLKYQGERILADLVDVLDNLELALQHKDSDADKLRTGLEMIQKQFVDTLARWEVKSVSAIGKDFDPNLQNAISKVPSSGDFGPGAVVGELKKTYFYKDKVLRVGEVVVAEGSRSVPTAEPTSAVEGEVSDEEQS